MLKLLPFFGFVCVFAYFSLYPLRSNHESGELNRLYAQSFDGEVVMISQARGFKVRLKNSPDEYNLSGTASNNHYLADSLYWGDWISKKTNSDTIILKSKRSSAVSEWKIWRQ